MTQFRKTSGNYREMIHMLGMPDSMYSPMEGDEYSSQVEKDLPRTAYVSYSDTVEQIKERLRNKDNLDQEIFYTQGDWDGSVFALTSMLSTYTALIEQGFYCKLNSLRFAYVDDDGADCGLTIAYLPAEIEHENNVPSAKRKQNFMVSIIKNTHAPVEERLVTLISATPLLTDKIMSNWDEIDAKDIHDSIKKSLNCEKLSRLISGVIEDDTISIEHVNALSVRIITNSNIDNRDSKQIKLNELISYAEEFVDLSQFKNQVMHNIKKDEHFFKDEHFKQICESLVTEVKAELTNTPDTEKNRTLFKIGLTSAAIQLEVLASEFIEEDEVNGLLVQAAQLRKKRDDEKSKIEPIDLTALEQEARSSLKEQWVFDRTISEYEQQLSRLKDAEDQSVEHHFYNQANELLRTIKMIKKDTRLSDKELPYLNEVLHYALITLKCPDDGASMNKLGELAEQAEKKSNVKWKRLAIQILSFAGIALICAGFLASIPTAGVSLALVAAGASALLGATVLARTKPDVQETVAKSISEFKSSLQKFKDEEPKLSNEKKP